MWQKWCVLKKMCRMETSFLISLTLVSNNNYWYPRKLHDQLRVTLTHTPALQMHNGRNYQELKREREKRETHAHNQQRTSPSCRIITNELRRYSVTKSSHSHIHPHYQYTMDETTSWSERDTPARNLLTRPDSTSSHVFVCRETKYFLGRRQCRGNVPVVSDIVEWTVLDTSLNCIFIK